MTTYRIKPLVWTENKKGFDVSKTPVGEFEICGNKLDDKIWLWHKIYGRAKDLDVCEDFDSAVAAAQSHYEARLKECLEEVLR
jgi:hypothetical protein